MKVTLNVRFDLDRRVWDQTRTHCGRDYLAEWSKVRLRQLSKRITSYQEIARYNRELAEAAYERHRIWGTSITLDDLIDPFDPIGNWFVDNWVRVLDDAGSCVTFAGIAVTFGPGILVQLGAPLVGTLTIAAVGCVFGIGLSEAGAPPNWP